VPKLNFFNKNLDNIS